MSDLFNHSGGDPTRLIEGDLSLRADLELARSSRVPYPVESRLAHFESTLAGASTLPAGGTLAGFAVLRWFLIAGASLGIAALVWVSFAPGQPPTPESAQARAALSSPHEVELSTRTTLDPEGSTRTTQVGTTTVETILEPETVAMASPGTTTTVGPMASPSKAGTEFLRAKSKATSTRDPPLSEAELIAAARKVLSDDPTRSLELTDRAAAAFPDGSMAQERRGYAILALLALERRGEAEQLAAAYLERWPKGPLSHRIREGLDLLP